MDAENLPDFRGKVIVFYLTDSPPPIQEGAVLEYAAFKVYGDKLFVVGRVPEIDPENGDWVANLQGGIAWDSVTSYLIFDSREDYINRMGLSQASLLQRLFGKLFV